MPSKSPTVIDIVKSRVKDRVIFRVKGRVRDLEQTAKKWQHWTAPANTTFWHLRSHNTSQHPSARQGYTWHSPDLSKPHLGTTQQWNSFSAQAVEPSNTPEPIQGYTWTSKARQSYSWFSLEQPAYKQKTVNKQQTTQSAVSN